MELLTRFELVTSSLPSRLEVRILNAYSDSLHLNCTIKVILQFICSLFPSAFLDVLIYGMSGVDGGMSHDLLSVDLIESCVKTDRCELVPKLMRNYS